MRNKNFALVALALAAVLTACSEKPAERPALPTRLQPVQALQMGQFEVTVLPEPEFTGPGMGRQSFPTIWTQVTEGSDGVPGTNPARTIQIASTANFAAGATPTNGDCLSTRFITTNVRLTNFYPERFVDPFVVITNSITGNELCNNGAQPVGGIYNFEDFSAGQPDLTGNSGIINYVTPDQTPRLSLAGSLVDTGASGGTPLDALWEFNYPLAQSTRITIRGQVWGYPMPDRPIPSGGTWGGYTEKDANLNWDVIDNADNLATSPRVDSNQVLICAVEPAADGTCAAPNFIHASEPGWGSQANGYEAFTLVTSGITALTVGEQYYVRLVNRWTNPGGGVVTGSLPYLERLRITGPVTPVSPADGATVTSGTQFVWTTAWPDPIRVNNGVVAFQICSDAACATPVVSVPNNATGFTAVDGGLGTWTFTTPALSTFTGLTSNTPYWWRARNIFAGREGAYSTPRAFRTP